MISQGRKRKLSFKQITDEPRERGTSSIWLKKSERVPRSPRGNGARFKETGGRNEHPTLYPGAHILANTNRGHQSKKRPYKRDHGEKGKAEVETGDGGQPLRYKCLKSQKKQKFSSTFHRI